MAPPPEMKFWLNWSELTGRPKITLSDFRTALGLFPRSAILIACARFSIIFNFGPEANTVASKAATEYWAPRLFKPELAPRALALAKAGRPIFFQGQVRFLASEAMRLDPAPLENGSQVPDWALGEFLLAAGDMLYRDRDPNAQEGLDQMADVIANFLPTYEIDCITDPFILFLRFHIYLTIIIPRLPANRRPFNVDAEFERAFGFPLALYTELVYAFTVHAMKERVDLKIGDVPEGGLATSWFKSTALTEDQVSRMFDTVCCRISDLPDTRKVHGYADFEFLKNHPYLRVDDKLYALDYEYAVAKLESGALWRVAETMEEKRRLGYFGFWGDVFEEYVNWIFEAYADETQNTYFPDPHYLLHRDNRPICDLIVVCGSTAVLVESKLATCPAAVRYSGDWKQIRKFLDRKLVEGTDRPVGVSQLHAAIEKIATKPKVELPNWLRNIRKFIPVIVTRDDIGSSWMTNGYLNARFQQLRRGRRYKKIKVTPLVSMSIGSLERGCAALGGMAFSDIVEDRIREDRNLGRPFELASSHVPRGTPRKMHKHIEVMKALGEEMRVDFGMPYE